MKFADVIIPLAVDGFFTYSVPSGQAGKIVVGSLVIVPFFGNKKYTGLVYRVHDKQPSGYDVKTIESVVEGEIRFSERHLRFLLWISEYYMAFPGDVFRAALPVFFRLESYTCITAEEIETKEEEMTEHERMLFRFLRPGEYVALKDIEKHIGVKSCLGIVRSLLDKGYVSVKETIDEAFREKREKFIRLSRLWSEAELTGFLDGLKRAPAQYALLCRFLEQGAKERRKIDFMVATGSSPAVLKALCDKGILEITEKTVSRLEENKEGEMFCHVLSERQEDALQNVRMKFEKKDCVLLQGVTSSGKTEIYIRLIQEAVQKGKQVLYMLPEIALTIQIINRLRRVFGGAVGVYHSGMPDAVRAELWKKQCGESPYSLILGVRSSVFLPFRDLGLIIVDEEHDASYKQKEPSPRYQARDAAIMLAKIHGAKILLGSATPSFESYENARSGKYGFVALTQRYGDIRMPQIILADLSEYKRKKLMKGAFTPMLYEEMKAVLEAGKQVILFQNRRGYSTYLQCENCGSILKCGHCDVSMTYYKQRGVMSCRYCGSLKSVPEVCDSCGVGHYRLCTPGTEKIEEEVARLFPDIRVARMDLEVMGSKNRLRSVIDDFEQGRTQVLIGTQMVSKGLDFENVKLVGVMDADSMINFPDFRAEERAYCMLMQVSGRSGRKGEQGKVVIQSGEVKNRIFPMLMSADYASFYVELEGERRFFAYPPFCRLIRVELRHKEAGVVRNAANLLAQGLREKLGKRVCGPAVPEVGKINNLYRVHLILKIEPGISFSNVKQFLKITSGTLFQRKEYAALRVICDVDP